MIRTTVTFVDASELYHNLGLTDDMVRHVDQTGFSNVSFGDADMTLVGNVFALDCIWEGLQDYYQMMDEAEDRRAANELSWVIPEQLYTLETFAEKYWQLVGEADYINLEG